MTDDRLAEIDALEEEMGELDLPPLALIDVLAIIADALDIPTDEILAQPTDHLLSQIIAYALESSSQEPHLRRGIEILARQEMLSQSIDADRQMGSPPY